MKGRKRAWVAVVLVACVMSLAGWAPLRSAEQLAAGALGLLDGVLGSWLPETEVADHAGEVVLAKSVFGSFRDEVGHDVPTPDGTVPVLASVVERRPDDRELVLRVPRGSVGPGAAVTHRQVLLGFVSELRDGGARAVVALLGHPEARIVAGQWRASETARPIYFLLDGRGRGVRVENRSSTIRPAPGQLAYTRDVGFLGDELPAGLLLGRVVSDAAFDAPGGAPLTSTSNDVRLESVVSPYAVGLVVVEGRKVASDGARHVTATPYLTSRSRGRWRVDEGSTADLGKHDWVLQDGCYVGKVDVVGRYSSEVSSALPGTELLVLDSAGAVVPCTPDAESWPDDWLPSVGDPVAGGHVELGGFFVGTISSVTGAGFELARVELDPGRPVSIVEP